jgi:purine-nucleoside phosphorylase
MIAAEYADAVDRAARAIAGLKPGFAPRAAVTLGSGLGAGLPRLEGAVDVPYEDIPGFPRSTVQGHAGRLHLGTLPGRGLPVAILQGRFHYFEGHPMESVTLPLRALQRLGLKTLILTSAVGSMRPDRKPGHVVVLKDHINLMGANPLRGVHGPQFGPMFPDLGDAYSPRLRKLALAECRRHKVPAKEGVYLAISGPSYETPAEIRAFRRLGGDVVGMSTVPEVIAARQLGVEVLTLSWISNMAAGLSKSQLTHEEVLELGRKMAAKLKGVLEAVLNKV